MQILELVLFSKCGKKRTLNLQPGKVNIITGGSATGKSSIIHIIDYCLGGACEIPDGVIRDKVSWYGLRLQFESSQIFIARMAPSNEIKNPSSAYILFGGDVQSPDIPPNAPNTNITSIIDLLNDKLRIAPLLNSPRSDSSIKPFNTTIRHSVLYCYQHQTEIANNSSLFHKQDDIYVALATKVTLPYFLGAIREDQLALEQSLNEYKKQLRQVEKELHEALQIVNKGMQLANSLVSEAKSVGLLNNNMVVDSDNILTVLQAAVDNDGNKPDDITISHDIIDLEDKIFDLQIKLGNIRREIRNAEILSGESKGFQIEASRHADRLESINLFHDNISNSCPLCQQQMVSPIPAADSIRNSLKKINERLKSAEIEKPRLRDFIEKLEQDKNEISSEIRAMRSTLHALINEREYLFDKKKNDVGQGRTVGRISLFLESTILTSNESELNRRKTELSERIKEIESLLDPEEKEEKMAYILNRIGMQMTHCAQVLDLEHSGNPVRFDPKRLTIYVDREDHSIPLKNIGSGKSWVGFHIITHLALHNHFIQNQRPVPRFLIIDQPSQAFYPVEFGPDYHSSIEDLKDEDKDSVYRIFNMALSFVERRSPEFQIIITDHADFKDSRFRACVVERWRDGNALIPNDW